MPNCPTWSPGCGRYVAGGETDTWARSALRLWFRDRQFPEIEGYYFVDSAGVWSMLPDADSGLIDVSDRDYFHRLRDHPAMQLFVSRLLLSGRRGVQRSCLRGRWWAKAGRFPGVVGPTLNLGRSATFCPSQSGAEGAIALRQGTAARGGGISELPGEIDWPAFSTARRGEFPHGGDGSRSRTVSSE